MKKFFLVSTFLILTFFAGAQVAGDFRSLVTPGTWGTFSHWERYNGSAWVTATSGQLPTATSAVLIRDGHTMTVSAATALAGNLTVGEGSSGTLVVNQAITVSGTTTITASGTISVTNTTAAKTFTGDFTNNGTWTSSVAANVTFGGNITNNATFTPGTGTYTLSNTPRTINGDFTFGTLAITASTARTNNGTLTVNTSTTINASASITNNGTANINGTTFAGTGTFVNAAGATLNVGVATVTPALTATATGNTVNYNSTAAAQTIKGAITYYNLTIDKSTTTATTGGIVTIAAGGSFNINSGTVLVATTNIINGNATATMSMASGATLQLGNGTTAVAFPANFTNTNISLDPASTVIYGCTTAAQTVSGVPTYGNLTISGTTSVKTLGAATTVNGNLTINNGTLATSTFALTGNSTGSLTMAAGTTMTLGSGATAVAFPTNFLPTNVVLAPTSTVTYASTANQTIAPVNYGNLTSSAGPRTLSSTGTIGIFTTFTAGTVAYTSTGSTVSFNGTAAQTIPNLTGGYNNLDVNKPTGIAASLAGTTTYTITGDVTVTSGVLADIVTAAVYLNMTSGGGAFTVADGAVYETLKLTGQMWPLGYGSYNFNTDGGFEYGGAGNVLIPTSPTTAYSRLIISGSGTKTLQANTTVNSLYVVAGTFADGGYNFTGTNTLSVANGTFLSLGSAAVATTFPTGFSTVTLGATSTVIYNSNQAQTISSAQTYGNLTTTATAAVTKTFDGNTTVQNIFTNGTNNTADFAGYTISVAGTTSCFANSGTINASNPSSKLLLNGVTTQTFALAGTYTSPGIANLEVASNATFNGTPSVTSIINNLQINSAKTFSIATYALYLGGTYTNNGTLTANSGNATIHFVGTSAQTFNIGTYTGNIIGIASTSGGIVINNAAGVTLNAPLNVAGLTLTNGLLNTDATNIISVTSTTSGSVSAGTSTSYVNGPMQRSFLAASSTTGVWTFPIGKATLGQFEIINPTQGAGTGIVVRAEVFDTPAGGTDGLAFSATPGSNRYWQVQKTTGTSVFNSIGAVEITDDSYTVTASNVIGNSSTLTGTYNTLGGTLAAEIISNSAVPPTLGYFVIGSAGCLNGTYTIGAGGDFTNLTSAVSTLNGSIVCSNLTFELRSDYTGTSGETFPIAINALTYGSGGPFDVVFRPQTGVTARVTSGVPVGSTTPLINFNGADRVTFDGRPGGVGTTSQWTLQNTQTSNAGSAVTFINDAQNNTLQYLTLQSSTTSNALGVISLLSGTTGNDNITIDNCNITRTAASNYQGIYSTGTSSTITNDNIVITNNNISLFTQYGINATTFNGLGWNISNNNIFNAPGSTAGIFLSSAQLEDIIIDGNKIGGTARDGSGNITGTWTGSAVFTGISLLGAGTTPSIITNNIIQGFSTTSNFTGITLSGSGNVNVGTAGNGNLIGHATTAGSITFTGTTFNGITNGCSGTVNIEANIIANITQNSTTGVTLNGIQNGSTGTGVINNNTIYNITSNSTTTTLAISGIIQTVTGATHSITNNKIYNLSKTGTTGTSNIYGLNIIGSSTTRNIAANNIYNLTAASTASTIRGIIINAGNFNLYNNFITLGNGFTTNCIVRGIEHTSSSASNTANIFHNSVFIGGTVSSGAINTAAYMKSSSGTHAVATLNNNIFINNRSGGTGRHAAVFASAITNLTSNYNLYQATGTGGALATYNNGTTYYTTIPDIQAATAYDDNSLNSDPQFVDPTNATTPDLHISLTNPTPIEAAGTTVSPAVADDIDGETRSALTPIDIGADAGAFAAIDQTAPTIVIGTITQPCNTATDLTFTATITDASGVKTASGLRPRVYFKKSTDSNDLTSTGWKWSEATNNSSPFSFTITFADLADGSASAGNIIQYFVVAQDSGANVFTPNVGISSGTFATAPTSVALTSTAFAIGGTLTSFTPSPCQGVISVGTGGDYPAFTTATGIFNAINGATLTGDLTINVVSNITIEDGTHGLNQWAESGIGGYKIKVQSSVPGTNRDISTSGTGFAGGLFRMNGADRITFYGGTGTARDLTFRNTNTGTAAATFVFLNDATNDTLQNCIIEGGTTNASTTSGTIYFSTAAASGTGNDNNVITGCDIRDLTTATAYPYTAIMSVGTAGRENSGNVISNCNIYNFYATGSQSSGIWLASGSSNFTIDGNRLYQTAAGTRTSLTEHYGIRVAEAVTGQTTTVSNNIIGYNSSAGTGSYTINTGGGSGRFTAIWAISGTTSITGNTIQAITYLSASTTVNITPPAFSGIYIAAGNSTVSGNTIGSTTSTASGTNISLGFWGNGVTQMYGIRSVSTGTVNISNNNIGNISLSTFTTTYGGTFYGINTTAGINTITGNTIGSPTEANSIQVTSVTGSANPVSIQGIVNTVTSGTQPITNNTIANLTNPNTSTNANTPASPGVAGINASGAGQYSITGNNVYNLSTGTLAVLTGASSAAFGIAVVSANTAGTTVSNNTVHSISSTATGTGAYSTLGIYLGITGGNATTNNISRNIVHSINNESTGTTSVIAGIQLISTSSALTLSNNMVRLGINAAGGSVATNNYIVGIEDNSTTAQNFYFNTVFIGGTVSSGAINSYAFRRVAASGGDIILNNIFANDRSGSTGKHFAFASANLTGILTEANFDYNIFYSKNNTEFSVDNGVNALTGATGALRLQALRANTTIGHNLHSGVGTLPKINFLNATGNASSVNLRLDNTNAAAGAGIAVAGITSDIDNTETRSNPPAIGAHETTSFVALNTTTDIYTPIVTVSTTGTQNTACGTTLTLPITATVTDVGTGLATGSQAPTLWYKEVSAGSWTAVTAGTPTGNTFPFTLSLTGVTAGQTYYYYVAAQDQAATPNVWYSHFNATTPVHTTVDVAASPEPAVYSSFNISPFTPLSGSISVGTGQTYTSLSGASGLFNAINNSGLVGDLNVTIVSNTAETGAVALNQWTEYCGSGYKLFIGPDGTTTRVLTGSATTALIQLNGADRVTIDGQFAGDGLQHLQFTNTSTTYNGTNLEATIYLQNDATDNVIKNSIIEGHTKYHVSGVNRGGVVTLGTGATTGNDNNTFEGNLITGTLSGGGADGAITLLYSQGTSSAVANNNITILNNNFKDFSIWNGNFNGGRCYGINVTATGNGSNWNISGNSFYNTFVGAESRGTWSFISFLPGASSANNTISNNWLGGRAPNGGADNAPMTNSYTNTSLEIIHYGMNINAGDVTIDGNNITNINITGIDYVGLRCIDITGSTVATITNNTFGSGTAGTPDGNKMLKCNGGASTSAPGPGYIYGIWNKSNTAATTTYSNNTFYYLWQSGAWEGGSVQCILHQTAGAANVTGNIINGPQAFGLGYNSFGVRIEPTTSTSGNVISQNQIAGPYINGNDASYYGASNFGIRVLIPGTSTVSGVIDRNIIWDMRNADFGGTGVTEGIYVYSTTGGNGNWDITNNQVMLKNNGSSSNCVGLYGIDIALNSASTTNVLYNTVYISGSNGGSGLVGADFSSYAFYRVPGNNGTVTGDNINLKNNIFINWRLVSTTAVSGHYAIANVGTSNFGNNFNNSDYNFLAVADGSRSYLGRWGTTNRLTLANWQTSSGDDLNSFTATYTAGSSNFASGLLNADNLFINPLSDVHISTADGESHQFISDRGTPISVTTDFDSEARSSTPDIGMDEFSTCSITNNVISTSSMTICSGTSPGLLNATTPSTTPSGPTFQWQSSTTSATTGFSNISGANAEDYTPGNLTQTTWFRRVVNVSTCSNTSTAIQVTVSPALAITSESPSGLVNSVCEGSTTFFEVTTTGSSLVYTWQVNSGSGWSTTGLGTTPYSGSGTNRLTVNNTPAGLNGNTYRVIVGNGGACPNDTSSVFTLNVNPNPVAPTFTAGTTTICIGGSDTYTATTTAGTITYSIVGGTGATINPTSGVVSSVTGNFTVRATATNICGTATTDRAVTVNPAPTVSSGGDQSICYTGGTITGATASNYGTITWTTSGTGTFSNANILAPTYTPSPGDIGAGSITLTITASNPGCTSAIDTKDVTILSANTWVGSVSNDWFTAANWCLNGAIPTTTTDVVIPNEALTNFDPLVNGVGGVCQNININTNGILGIAGTNNLDIYGDWNNSGTFNINNSTVTFRGSTNTNIGGFASPQPFYNLTINKGTSTASVTTTADIDVANLITITQGHLVIDGGTVVDMGSVGTVVSSNGTFHVNGGDATATGINASGTVNVETGTLGVANTVVLTAGTFTQTGGVATLNTGGVNTNSNAVFTADANSNLNISGGSVIFERANAGTGYDVSIISGSGTKNITGGTFQFGNASTPASQVFKVENSSVDFNNVTINSNNNPTVRLISNVAINSTGVLSIGSVLDLNQKLMLVNNNSASAITRSGSGYVLSETQIGSARLVWNIGGTTATNYVFPLGNAAGDYMPLTMRLNSGNIGFAGVSSFKSVNVSSGNWPTGAEQVTNVANPAQAIQRFWHLESSASPSSYNVDVTFSYNAAEDPTAGPSSVVKMQRYNKPTNSWDLALANQIYTNTTTRTVMVPGITKFSWWGGGNDDSNNNPLPVELTHFGATCDGNVVNVGWTTSTETNNDYFTVQRSTDLVTFNNIAVIEGAGNSNTTRNYTIIDNNPVDGVAYYRLVQTDFNGVIESFSPVVVTCSTSPADVVSIYPNPAQNELHINVNLTGTDKGTLAIYNSFGQVVTMQTINAEKGFNNYTMDVSGLAAGQYFVSVNLGTRVLPVQKLVITK